MAQAMRASIPGDRRMGEKKGDRQRRAILDAIPSLLVERSFSALSISAIAKAAGLSRSGFYFYFDTKETALAVALAEAWQDLEERNNFFRERRPGDSLYDHVRRSVTATADVWREHSALLIAFMQFRDTEPVLEEMWDGWMGGMATRLAAFIDGEREAGRAEPIHFDTQRLASVVLDMIAGTLYRTVRRNASDAEMAEQIDLLTRLTIATSWGPAAPLPSPIEAAETTIFFPYQR